MRLMDLDRRESEEVRALMPNHVDGELDPDGRRRVDEHASRAWRERG